MTMEKAEGQNGEDGSSVSLRKGGQPVGTLSHQHLTYILPGVARGIP